MEERSNGNPPFQKIMVFREAVPTGVLTYFWNKAFRMNGIKTSFFLALAISFSFSSLGQGKSSKENKLDNLLALADSSLKANKIDDGLGLLQSARPLLSNNSPQRTNFYWLYAELLYKQKKYSEMELKSDSLLSISKN